MIEDESTELQPEIFENLRHLKHEILSGDLISRFKDVTR